MSDWPDREALQDAQQNARAASEHFRLPFHRQAWSGLAGNWAGAGVGSSIDFQDHRPYLPGDDPRHIDWQAYARSGHYIMKLYREEVSPRLDLVFDHSASMRLNPAKAARSLELYLFCRESAARSGASLRAFALGPPPAPPFFQSLELSGAVFPTLGKIPLRPPSLRVLISDLLFPGEPEPFLRALRSARGPAVVLAPADPAESDPDWDGNLELVDCESGVARIQRVDAAILDRYRTAYRRHLDLWRDAGRRLAVPVAVVSDAVSLVDALRSAMPTGAVEAWM